jgi:hypothetical protein
MLANDTIFGKRDTERWLGFSQETHGLVARPFGIALHETGSVAIYGGLAQMM